MGYSMAIVLDKKKLIKGVKDGCGFICGLFWQNATDIIAKCDSYSITKCDKSLLQNESGFLLQNALVQVPATMPQLVERFFLISKEIQFWL